MLQQKVQSNLEQSKYIPHMFFSCFRMFTRRRRFFTHFSFINRFIGTFAEPKEIQVPVPWGHVAVKQWGASSQPLVLCVHGYLDNAGTFDRLIPLLPKRYCYLAMDYPGHGLSSASYDGIPYTDDLYAESMNRVQRYFGNQKIGIIGHSMGGALGVRYLTNFVGTASFGVAMDMPVLPTNSMLERVQHAARRIDKIIRQFSAKDREPARTMEELLRATVVGWGGSIDHEAAVVLLKRGAKPVGEKFKLSRQLPCGNNQVWGQNDDFFVNFDQPPQDVNLCAIEFVEGIRFYSYKQLRTNLEAYKKAFKMVEYHALRGTHHLLLMHPQVVSKVITEFMDRAEQQ